MEEELREMLRSASSGAPVPSDPSPQLMRRVRVQRILNATGTVVVIAGLVAGGITGARLIGSAPEIVVTSRPELVPWVGTPPAPPPATSPAPAMRICVAQDLRLGVKPIAFEGAAGSAAGALILLTERACMLRLDRLNVLLVDADGSKLPITALRSGRDSLVMVPGRNAAIMLLWRNWCEMPPKAVQVRVEFAGGADGFLQGDAASVDGKTPVNAPACNARGAGSTLSFEPIEPGDGRMTPLQGITAEIQPPDSANAGKRLRYLVVLHNTTPKEIALDPCPNYTQSLGIDGRDAVTGTYRLNCDFAGGPIRPDERISFEMLLDVPSGTAPGIYTITWSITGAGPANKVPVRIV